jgi:hypothetical protein
MQAFAITDYLTENDIQYCEENYEQYKLIGDYEFLERERHTIEARVCVHLYNDSVWSDASKYRAVKLLERGNYYVNVEIEQSKANAESGTIPQKEKPLTDLQKAINQITALEKKVAYLEKKIAQKDAVIMEQVKVILDLANKIKSAVFAQIPWFDLKL